MGMWVGFIKVKFIKIESIKVESKRISSILLLQVSIIISIKTVFISKLSLMELLELLKSSKKLWL